MVSAALRGSFLSELLSFPPVLLLPGSHPLACSLPTLCQRALHLLRRSDILKRREHEDGNVTLRTSRHFLLCFDGLTFALQVQALNDASAHSLSISHPTDPRSLTRYISLLLSVCCRGCGVCVFPGRDASLKCREREMGILA